MPKKFVPQSRAPRSRRDVKPPQQPRIISFRLSPAEVEQLNAHLAEAGINRLTTGLRSEIEGVSRYRGVRSALVPGISSKDLKLIQ